MADETLRNDAGQFVVGHTGMGGRPKGSRNKLGEAFIDALHDDFNKHGIAAIQTMREERPHEYVKVVAGILPKEFKITDERELSDDELNRRIRELATVLGDYLNGESGISETVAGDRPETAH